ncbi:MAG TPA: carboxylating nicotinate-nucleotide diphosphorylase [Candidatus Gastranaerophilales bacterium]|nr:carboxylating nicotinate-nucleotide diphosphorylase [Candidatus Gastranaerophilales bacterium]
MISLDSLMAKDLVKQALIEDIGHGDLTTDSFIDPEKQIIASYNVREDGIIAGLPLLKTIFSFLDAEIKIETFIKDGNKIKAGQKIAVISGNARAILAGERVSLNFLQRMSAIATLTNKYQEAIKPYKAKVCDTRKSCPNFRVFEKYSVGIGGGSPHRFGLYDAVMIKDNHIEITGSIKEAVKVARSKIPHTVKIEVETENLDQVKEAFEAGADIILLDNMPVEMMKNAVDFIDDRVIIEASGAISLENINKSASSGVNYISTSSITAKAGVLDIGLDI